MDAPDGLEGIKNTWGIDDVMYLIPLPSNTACFSGLVEVALLPICVAHP